MKKIIQVTLFLLIWVYSKSTAQNAAVPLDSAHSRYFITLSNGKTIYANDLSADYSYHNQSPYLVLDNRMQYGLDSVVSYQASNGYFQKFPTVPTPNITQMWFKREEVNKINIYSKRYAVPNLTYIPIGLDGGLMPIPAGTTHEKKDFYFQVGNQIPQRFTYNNLKDVVSSNPQSLKLINQGHNLAQLKGLMIVAGAAMFLVGVVKGSCNTEKAGDCEKVQVGPSLTLALAGLTTGLVPLLIHPSKKYQEAVYHFNRQ